MLRALETLQLWKNTGQNGGVSTKRTWQNWAKSGKIDFVAPRTVLGVQCRMLPRLILILVVVLSSVLVMAAKPPDDCCQAGAVRLSSSKVKTLLLKTQPIEVPGTSDGLHIKGTIVVSVAVSTSGEVICVAFVSGHPLLISAAIESVRLWKFHPYSVGESKKGFCGRIAIKYEAIGHGVRYEVI
jgi:hypothetical protein